MVQKFILIVMVFFLFSCKNGKQASTHTAFGQQLKQIQVTEGCPKGANCHFEIFANKRYSLKEGNTGVAKPQLKKDENFSVVKFTYSRKQNNNISDDQYREEIFVTMPNNVDKFEAVSPKELRKANVVFGRFCFCPKDQIGFVPVENGRIKIQNGQIRFNLQNEKLPQVIKEVAGKF